MINDRTTIHFHPERPCDLRPFNQWLERNKFGSEFLFTTVICDHLFINRGSTFTHIKFIKSMKAFVQTRNRLPDEELNQGQVEEIVRSYFYY